MALILKNYVSPEGVPVAAAYCRIARVLEGEGGTSGEVLVEVHASEAARQAGQRALEHWSFKMVKDADARSWDQAYAALIDNPFADRMPDDDSDLAIEPVPTIPADAALGADIFEGASEDERVAIIAERRARFDRTRIDAEDRNAARGLERTARAARRAMFAKAKRA